MQKITNHLDICYDSQSILTIEQQQALSMGAMLSWSNHFPINVLEVPKELLCETMEESKESFNGYWGILTHAQAISNLQRLLNVGHRSVWPEVLSGLQSNEETTERGFVTNLKASIKALQKQRLIENKSSLQKISISAWDMGRIVFVAQKSCLHGYITVDEAWPFIMAAFDQVRKTYRTWAEFGKAYLIGRYMWGGQIVGAEKALSMVYVMMLEWPESIWNKYPLHAAEKNQHTIDSQILVKGISSFCLSRKDHWLPYGIASVGMALFAQVPIVRKLVVRILINHAAALAKQGKIAPAIAAYEWIDQQYEPDKAMQSQVARALVHKGILFSTQRWPWAVAVYDLVDQRYGNSNSAIMRGWVAKALFNKGVRLNSMRQSDNEMAVYDLINQRYGRDEAVTVREWVARALLYKAITFDEAGKTAAALTTYDLIDQRYGQDKAAVVREQVTKALVNKAIALGNTGKTVDKIATCDLINQRYGQDKAIAVRELVVKALFNKAITLDTAGKINDALATCDLIERRYGQDMAVNVRELVVRALFHKAIALASAGKTNDALAKYDLIIQRYGQDKAAGVQGLVIKALFIKATTLGDLGETDNELALYDRIDRHYGQDAAVGVREQVADALLNKAVTLHTAGKANDALATYNLIDRRYGQDDNVALQESVIKALVSKGSLLNSMGKRDDALTIYNLVDQRYGQEDSDVLRDWVDKALARKTDLLSGLV